MRGCLSLETTKPSMYDLEIQKKMDAIERAEKLGNDQKQRVLAVVLAKLFIKIEGF